ncbi:MAG: hypothetical protein R3F43_24685 [bacterium]
MTGTPHDHDRRARPLVAPARRAARLGAGGGPLRHRLRADHRVGQRLPARQQRLPVLHHHRPVHVRHGVGSYITKRIEADLLERFVQVEIAVALVGGLSSTLLFLVFPYRAFYVACRMG